MTRILVVFCRSDIGSCSCSVPRDRNCVESLSSVLTASGRLSDSFVNRVFSLVFEQYNQKQIVCTVLR